MAKYRLKRNYHGSGCVLGEIVSSSGIKFKDETFAASKIIVESNPYFWELVDDYIITAFKKPGDEILKKLGKNGKYHWDVTNTEDTAEALLKRSFEIYSVIRTEDDIEFKIGDRVSNSTKYNTVPSFINKNITKFVFNESNKCITALLDCDITNKTWDGNKGPSILAIEHTKELFKTEDGVPVFPNTHYFCVNTSPHLWTLFGQTAKERTLLNKTVKAFSTKELAEEYLFTHKPVLSINDISKVYSTATLKTKAGWSSQAEKLRKIARENV